MSAGLLVPLLVGAAISVALTPAFIHLGRSMELVDVPNARSSHSVPTPRTGGFAIMLGIVVAIAVSGHLGDRGLFLALLAAASLGLLALADDLRPLPTVLRLVSQLGIAAALVLLVPALVGGLASHGAWPAVSEIVAMAVAIVWLVGVVNAYNFMDGINGIASLEAAVCGLTLAILMARSGDDAGAALAVGVVGAALGFLPWNLVRGAIFMGDVGSTGLGLLLAMLVLRAGAQGSVIAAALPLTPFLLDTSVTIVRRVLRGERSIMTAHRTHFYQLLALRQGHARVSLLWAGLAGCSAVVSLSYGRLSGAGLAAALLALLCLHVLVGWGVLRASRGEGRGASSGVRA